MQYVYLGVCTLGTARGGCADSRNEGPFVRLDLVPGILVCPS